MVFVFALEVRWGLLSQHLNCATVPFLFIVDQRCKPIGRTDLSWHWLHTNHLKYAHLFRGVSIDGTMLLPGTLMYVCVVYSSSIVQMRDGYPCDVSLQLGNMRCFAA